MSFSITFDIPEFDHQGECYVINGVARFDRIDEGIGSYEFWGAHGNHVQWVNDFIEYEEFNPARLDTDGNAYPVSTEVRQSLMEDDELILKVIEIADKENPPHGHV